MTRSLLKRQMRAAVDRHAQWLSAGVWVLRLRAPFARETFPSAASDALRDASRHELDELLARLAPRAVPSGSPRPGAARLSTPAQSSSTGPARAA